MTIVFHAWPNVRLTEIQSNLRRKKRHRTNQGSNFLGGSFSNRNNVRASIQFGRERQPQHLKRRIFLKNRPIHFHINSTSLIRLIKQNQLSFSSIEINKPIPAPIHSVSDSDSSSEANSSCCHRSDASSHSDYIVVSSPYIVQYCNIIRKVINV